MGGMKDLGCWWSLERWPRYYYPNPSDWHALQFHSNGLLHLHIDLSFFTCPTGNNRISSQKHATSVWALALIHEIRAVISLRRSPSIKDIIHNIVFLVYLNAKQGYIGITQPTADSFVYIHQIVKYSILGWVHWSYNSIQTRSTGRSWMKTWKAKFRV